MGRRTIVSPPRRERRHDVVRDPQEMERLVRLLGAAGNVRILGALCEARRREPEGGWMFLSEIAAAVGEAPGSVGLAVQKLMPLLEEERRKGRRWFRSRVRDVAVVVDEW